MANINLGRLNDTQAVTGSVTRNDRFDTYRFRLNDRSSLQGTLENFGGGNADLELFNGARQRIAKSTTSGNESITQNLDAGIYFLRVKQRSGNTSFRLTLSGEPLKLFGLTEQNNLVAFNADSLNAINVGSVTGLAAGETLVGIDFRATIATVNGQSLNGTLYGVSNTNRLYTINTANGQATQVGTTPFAPGLDGTFFGVDFNPSPDRLRVVSNNDQNLRLVPDGAITPTGTPAPAGTVVDSNATTAGTQTDSPPLLTYITGDPNVGLNPNVVATAYANNLPGGRVTQFVIDADLDILARQGSSGGNATSPGGSPNGGLLTTVGALGFDFGNTTAFDISTDSNLADTAIATSGSTLYGINLATGAAKNLGTVTVNGSAVNLVGISTRIV